MKKRSNYIIRVNDIIRRNNLIKYFKKDTQEIHKKEFQLLTVSDKSYILDNNDNHCIAEVFKNTIHINGISNETLCLLIFKIYESNILPTITESFKDKTLLIRYEEESSDFYDNYLEIIKSYYPSIKDHKIISI